jgi:hypothetical protein
MLIVELHSGRLQSSVCAEKKFYGIDTIWTPTRVEPLTELHSNGKLASPENIILE